ncbi:putative zygotic DNA replication licensing factor mcm3 [Apostichopus japonicus]|uniref:DNA replication licensing factor MCM3 n=1 Tax=Stichopus japonicus TaxID=307972 RepID=A0A2G8JRZ9_STIJA|nr:putative zygotic DNA replication licensing factor mcm3 [Apostichopus japonicus]
MDGMANDIDQQLRDYQREYLDFIDDDADQGLYHEKVRDMINKNKSRLIVNINDLRRKAPKRASRVLTDAHEEIIALQRALRELVSTIDVTFSKQYEEFFVGYEGSFGSKHLTPRTLTARHLGNLVCVEGIVVKCSLVRPKIVRSVHYCPQTKKTMERKYTDLTSLDAFPSSSVYPTKDDQGNPLETEYGLSTYKDHQSLTIQEMPEKAPAGQLPRSVDIIVDDDLVDICKPGDRVQVIGTYRCLPNKQGGYTNGTFRTILLANNIRLMSKEVAPTFSRKDVHTIRDFATNKNVDVFEVLAKSLAPSIHGHEYIKKAVLCMLLGGSEKVLDNGTRLRGDINVLLIGDPSTAKSQMLSHGSQSNCYYRKRFIWGGLTAAVTTDQETGERRLEAGAMVLADRGVVCIDEFDKMTDQDRTAIHEVMEQGRVTIAKAGIHAQLNARCSVLAAANPVYGRYDQYKTPMENIGLQDSLLSRFDLIFIVLDQMDPDHDRKISDHVLRIHRYRAAGEQDGAPLPLSTAAQFLTTQDDEEEKEDRDTQIYDKHNKMLHGTRKKQKFISVEFMRKFIHLAKNLKPQLTAEAADCISDEYSKLRSQEAAANNVAKTQPVTARSLETMIRLSTAHAKSRLSKTIDLQDAEAAIELVQFAIFKKVLEKKKNRKEDDDSDSDEERPKENGHDEEVARAHQKKRSRKPKGTSKKTKTDSQDGSEDPYDFDSYEESAGEEELEVPIKWKDSEKKAASESDGTSGKISEERLKSFRSAVSKAFSDSHAQSLPLDKILEELNTQFTGEDKFEKTEVDAALSEMQDANQVMVSDNIVFLI